VGSCEHLAKCYLQDRSGPARKNGFFGQWLVGVELPASFSGTVRISASHSLQTRSASCISRTLSMNSSTIIMPEQRWQDQEVMVHDSFAASQLTDWLSPIARGFNRKFNSRQPGSCGDQAAGAREGHGAG
jgi:hypothetical protein